MYSKHVLGIIHGSTCSVKQFISSIDVLFISYTLIYIIKRLRPVPYKTRIDFFQLLKNMMKRVMRLL